MTKEKERTLSTSESEFIEGAENQFADWQDDIDRLEDKIKSAGDKIQREYNEQIATLKRYLDDVEEQISELDSADADQWEEQRLNVQKAGRNYHQAYSETIIRLKKARNVPAGWLEGFTDYPPSGSAGWLEGFGVRPIGSEGWVEGMAEQTPESEGWTEGYGKKD